MLKRPSLGRGSGKLREASQGPVQLPHPLDDLLVGEVGSRAASIFMNCETITMAVTSFANVSLPVLMPLYAFQ